MECKGKNHLPQPAAHAAFNAAQQKLFSSKPTHYSQFVITLKLAKFMARTALPANSTVFVKFVMLAVIAIKIVTSFYLKCISPVSKK